MVEVYRGLQIQARFYERSWDRVVSKARGSGYGNSDGKGIGTTRHDHTLPWPGLPSLPALQFTPVYAAGRYSKLVDEAGRLAAENNVLLHRIYENLSKADRNRYNLEVFLSLAELTGHHNRMILGMKEIEDRLRAAREQAEKKAPQEAVGQLVAAYNQKLAGSSRNGTRLSRLLRSTWEKSRFPKGREVNGRKFQHVAGRHEGPHRGGSPRGPELLDRA